MQALPWPFDYLNIVFLAGVFITFAIGYSQGLWFAFFCGLAMDFFSYLPFGTMTLLQVLSVIAINFMFINFFTNRSLYSLIFLGFLGNIIYIIGLLTFNFIFFVLNLNNNLDKFLLWPNLAGLMWQILFSVIVLGISFFVFSFFGKKIKKIFY